MKKPDFIVCGTVKAPNAQEGRCTKCQAIVWPSSGSLCVAVEQKIPLICLDCFATIPDYSFGGFLHHGRSVPESIGNKLLMALEMELAKNKSV